LQGILNIRKPQGLTSRQVVDRVVQVARTRRVGHAGTLDPLATGVLVVCLGQATRLVEQIQSQAKEYVATFLLGQTSDTDDITGHVEICEDVTPPSLAEVTQALEAFQGEIEQVPPQFSAVRVGGKRAYALARRGQSSELQPRRVTITEIELLAYAYPRLELRIECGSGTYVRSIGRDLGTTLGCGALMSGLVRTRIGAFRIEEAVPLEELTAETWSRHLQPAVKAVTHLPQMVCSEEKLAAIRQGRSIPAPATAEWPVGEELALVTQDGILAALVQMQPAQRIAPSRVFQI